jgi:hypothetical protein
MTGTMANNVAAGCCGILCLQDATLNEFEFVTLFVSTI